MAGVPCSVPLTASHRCTTPASVPSPRCCGPSAGARLSHACSEPLAAPQVTPLSLRTASQPLAQHLLVPLPCPCPTSWPLSCRDLPAPVLGGL